MSYPKKRDKPAVTRDFPIYSDIRGMRWDKNLLKEKQLLIQPVFKKRAFLAADHNFLFISRR